MVLVVVYLTLRLIDLLSLAAFTAALSFARVGALDLDAEVTVADRDGLDGPRDRSPWQLRPRRARRPRSSAAAGAGRRVRASPGWRAIAAPFGYSAALSTSRSSCSFQER